MGKQGSQVDTASLKMGSLFQTIIMCRDPCRAWLSLLPIKKIFSESVSASCTFPSKVSLCPVLTSMLVSSGLFFWTLYSPSQYFPSLCAVQCDQSTLVSSSESVHLNPQIM
ncbi:hypothetical protein BsWGS_08517 [Bradybaena similaris]